MRTDGDTGNNRKPLTKRAWIATAALASLLASPAHANLVISPVFDSSITSLPQATRDAVEADINQAASVFSVFTDPVTVSILFQAANKGTSSFLGESGSSRYGFSYGSYTNALLTDATANQNHVEMTAYNHLGSGNQATNVVATSAAGRAIGCGGCSGTVSHIDFTSNTVVFGGTYDGAIGLNLDQPFAFTRSGGTVPSGKYDILSVIEHEMDEVLGIGGAGSLLPNNASASQIGSMDLFRYSAPGTATLSTSGSAYFSIDGGVTQIAGFNQNSGGDFGDWVNGTGHVQDAFTPTQQVSDVTPTSPEGIALQAIGYDVDAPELGGLVVLGAGIVLMATFRSSRRNRRGLIASG